LHQITYWKHTQHASLPQCQWGKPCLLAQQQTINIKAEGILDPTWHFTKHKTTDQQVISLNQQVKPNIFKQTTRKGKDEKIVKKIIGTFAICFTLITYLASSEFGFMIFVHRATCSINSHS